MNDGFINIQLNTGTLDRFIVRHSILRELNGALSHFSGHLLDIGCGGMPYKQYLLNHSAITNYTGLDIEGALTYNENVRPDFTWNGIVMPFQTSSFDTAFGTEVLEHCPDPQIVLQEVYRVLKPGGHFFFTVPFLWPLHEVPHDEYRYTPFSLERHLKNAGFSQVHLQALGGWDASLAQMLGLWVRRRKMSTWKRKLLSSVLKPIIARLIRKDFKPASFTESTMITGISGIAVK